QPPLAALLLRDVQHPGEHDVEPVARLALADDRRSGQDLLPLQPPRELREALAGQAREELDAGQLMDGRRNVARTHRDTVARWGSSMAGVSALSAPGRSGTSPARPSASS